MCGTTLARPGWHGSSSLVPTPKLWEQLLHELDRPGRTVECVKVPSHVQVSGNKEADKLARAHGPARSVHI